MENDEYSAVLENLVSGGGLQPNVQPMLDPAAAAVQGVTSTPTRTGLRPRLTSNSMVPSSITHPRMAHLRSPVGKTYTEFMPRASDDEASNLSVASVLDDHSSFSSEDANALLRDKANGRLQQQKRTGSFVPDVAPGSSVSPNESGFLLQAGEDVDSMGVDDELQQQVPVSKFEELELRILRQPEEQHRARYMSEGSRGSVKDRSGKSHVTVALRGCYRPAILEIFAAIGSGPVVPHPLYRLIPVTGKNGSSVTSCKEGVTADGAACLQVVLRPENKMTAVLDCIGILKICSYDLKRKLPKQSRSASVRLVFRVTVPAPQDRRQNVILQTVSLPIVCAQQPGYPDVSRISCTSSSVRGNVDVFIVGKNFSNNATVQMKEYGPDGKVVWSAQAPVDQQHTHTCHMICTVPPYRDLYTNKPVEAMLTVECGKKVSRPLSFKYLPENPVNNSVAGQLQQQMAYNQTYDLGGTGSTGADASNHGATTGFPGSWTGTDFASGMGTDQPQQQQYQQAATSLMPVAPSAVMDQSSNHAPLNLQSTPSAPSTIQPMGPAVVTQTAFGDFLDNGTKPEPMLDDQNASFYYSNQYSDKPSAAKRPRVGEDTFTVSNDPFGFSLEDLPQILS